MEQSIEANRKLIEIFERKIQSKQLGSGLRIDFGPSARYGMH